MPNNRPSSSELAALRAFMSWGSKQSGFPYGSLSYWIGTYERGDGKDVYEHRLRPATKGSTHE